jgi:hypothetical protein
MLVVGGVDPNFGNALAVVELFDPTAGTFTATGLGTARVNPTATLLKNGQVLVAGGGPATAELYQ